MSEMNMNGMQGEAHVVNLQQSQQGIVTVDSASVNSMSGNPMLFEFGAGLPGGFKKKKSSLRFVWIFPIAFVIVGVVLFLLFTGVFTPSVDGPLVVGKLVSVDGTGVMINKEPMLNVTVVFTTEKGKQVTASFQDTFDAHDQAILNPGILLPIRYDTSNPSHVGFATDAKQPELDAAYDRYLVVSKIATQHALDLKQHGTHAQGVVLSAKATGKIVDGRTEMSLTVNVTGSGGDRKVTVTKSIPAEAVSQLAEGKIVEVYFDAKNPDDLVIGYHFVERYPDDYILVTE
jgi:hypothetical protein